MLKELKALQSNPEENQLLNNKRKRPDSNEIYNEQGKNKRIKKEESTSNGTMGLKNENKQEEKERGEKEKKNIKEENDENIKKENVVKKEENFEKKENNKSNNIKQDNEKSIKEKTSENKTELNEKIIMKKEKEILNERSEQKENIAAKKNVLKMEKKDEKDAKKIANNSNNIINGKKKIKIKDNKIKIPIEEEEEEEMNLYAIKQNSNEKDNKKNIIDIHKFDKLRLAHKEDDLFDLINYKPEVIHEKCEENKELRNKLIEKMSYVNNNSDDAFPDYIIFDYNKVIKGE